MTERVWPKCGWTSVACVLVLLHACLGQKDCTGVDCPYLDGCIEEVLQDGACCATCLQRGCVCKGYQFYDCISGGFKSGKVPEGAWYLVDSGSTECRCPAGGGHIRCRFIPCPDVPSHCIELSDSTEACPHCLRLGCVHRNHKYEAGHSFHMDPCQVCHCPNDGGDLMCSVIPDCSSETLRNPEEQEKERRISKHPEDFLQKLSRNSVPIHTEDTAGFENGEDYDYFPEAFPPSSADRQTQNLDKVLREGTREELRETPSTRDDEIPREEEPEDSLSAPTAETDSRSFDKFSSQTETVGRYHQVSPRVTTHSSADISSNHRNLQNSIPELNTISKLQFVSTTTPPVRTRERQAHRQPQTLGRYHQERNHLHLKPHRQRVTSAEVSMCCVAGETWASAHGNCNNMEPIRTEPGSSCWWVQTQCCVSSLRERLCWSGINAARRGGDCGAQHEDLCDSNKECCTCCAVGLRLRAQRESCDPPQGLGVSCSHALLTCCEGTDLTNQSVVRKRTHPQTTNPIRRVSEGPEHQAFSLEELEDTENMVEQVKGLVDLEHVEGLEDKENIVDKVEGLLDTENVKGLEDKKNMVDKVEGLEKKDNLVETAEGLKDKENMVEQVQDLEDECSVYAGQLCHHQCVNTQGSYVCVCFPGFVMQPDRIQCLQEVSDDEDGQDKDEVSTTSLKPTETSITSPPERPEPCEGNGHCAQHCHPVDGQAHCSCSPGFTLMPDRLSCEDVDECSLSTHSCELNERCENIEGSFRCLQQVDCPPGYELRNDLCEDVNECALGAHGCGPGFDCINTAGSFSCRATPRCPGGFTLDSQGQCSDVDECRTVTQPCSPGFNCVNTAGSYTCQRKIILCGRGYHSSPDGTRCIDSDECESGVHRCGEAQICQNLPGTYRCDCQPGYQYDMYRRVCVDVNECWRYASAPCAQVCVNTPGSYHCSCNSGFTLSSDGKSCEDVNECLNSPCSHECVNVYGSYQCYCRQGYYLREDTHICEDVDECSQSAEHLCAYKCVNVPGSYECVCPEPGYSMAPNRRSCQDIDECTVGAHNCTADETCYNIHGGFRCLSFSCPNNYRRASDTRCDRISCSNFLECQNSPVRITFYQLSFQINIMVPALVFRMGPSPAYSGDNVIISIASGNQDGYFSPRKLNAYTGAVYLQRQFLHPRDFLLDVEMKLWRQGTFTTFIARIYIFITPNAV